MTYQSISEGHYIVLCPRTHAFSVVLEILAWFKVSINVTEKNLKYLWENVEILSCVLVGKIEF